MQAIDLTNASIDKVELSLLQEKNIKLSVLRIDKIHPVISGNKWFKLKYHLENYVANKYEGILTFGGAWSNHIIASACTCSMLNIKSTGIIRGEEPKNLSATLQFAHLFGMQLKFISRENYKQKNSLYLIELKKQFPNFYFIPEGGSGESGEKGAGEILDLVNKENYTHIACAIGTGTMFRGICKSSIPTQKIIGIEILKGLESTTNPISNAITIGEFHFGGYAKYTSELINFMNYFYEETKIPTDFVYTGKLFYAVMELIKKNKFPQGSKLLVIHSGGLQGNDSLQKDMLRF